MAEVGKEKRFELASPMDVTPLLTRADFPRRAQQTKRQLCVACLYRFTAREAKYPLKQP